MQQTPRRTIIIGAGVFGASTALHLQEAEPDGNIILIDRTQFTSPFAASHDINKVVRADYGEPFYCGLALEALAQWRSGALYKPFFHQSGLMNVENTGLGRQIIKNFQDMGIEHSAKILSPETAKSLLRGNFAKGDWTGVEEVYWNPQSGWADATEACTRVTQAAVDSGVVFMIGSVETLAIDERGTCTGVNLDDGQHVSADRMLLCTGANTTKLLADSAPTWQELQVNSRLVAAGVVIADIDLSEQQVEQLQGIPVFVGGMHYTEGETMPPTTQHKMKLCKDSSFTQNEYHQPTGMTFSTPRKDLSKNTWGQDVPQGLKDEIQNVLLKSHGPEAGNDFKINSYRMCWDAVTPDQSFIIGPHPACKNLYIATAGSFHGWKFLPILGKYVVQMLQGSLDAEKAQRWAWDRPTSAAAHGGLLPQRDLSDIPGWAELNE